MHPLQYAAIILAAFAAGAINSVAGGGTLLSFPTMLWVGLPPITANATNTVALWPGSLGGVIGFRRELRGVRDLALLLLGPSLAGGIAGALLLLRTPSHLFEHLAPYLVLAATLLLAAQEPIGRRLPRRGEPAAPGARSRTWAAGAVAFQFVVALYGGYFGAGMGILMLAALGLLGLSDIHQMNGLKNLLAIAINGVAAAYFIAAGAIVWNVAIVMAIASIIGGLTGARVAHRVGREVIRRTVIVIGLAMAASLLVRLYA